MGRHELMPESQTDKSSGRLFSIAALVAIAPIIQPMPWALESMRSGFLGKESLADADPFSALCDWFNKGDGGWKEF
jgi:hypothetical protein